MVTEPWLRNWREHLKNMGFDRETARLFYGESAHRIVCVCEGKREEQVAHLEEFSEYVDLPFMVVEADYHYIRLMLKHLSSEWDLRKARERNESEIASYRKQSADYMTMFELIKNLTRMERESEVIETVRNGLSVLFSCRIDNFCSARREGKDCLDEKCILFLRSGEQYRFLEDNAGFMLRIEHAGQAEGILVFRDFQFPEYVSRYLSFCLNVAGVIGLAISNSRKMEIIKKNESEMEYIGTHDGMTGIFNRRFFDEKVMELQESNLKEGLCVMLCDMDGLKEINDIHGHDAGDLAIKAVVKVLKKCFRDGDILARIGGDEFAALLPGYPASAVKDLSRRIRRNLEEYNLSSGDMPISFSFGLVHGFPPGEYIQDLVKRADEMMYKRKMTKKAADRGIKQPNL
jgi:diguanylate cyclase (GGDEF)-like protein